MSEWLRVACVCVCVSMGNILFIFFFLFRDPHVDYDQDDASTQHLSVLEQVVELIDLVSSSSSDTDAVCNAVYFCPLSCVDV